MLIGYKSLGEKIASVYPHNIPGIRSLRSLALIDFYRIPCPGKREFYSETGGGVDNFENERGGQRST